jgi:hypothetical protein
LQLIIVQKNICGIIIKQRKLDEYGKEMKNDILIIDAEFTEHVYVDLATVATIEISDKDKGPYGFG